MTLWILSVIPSYILLVVSLVSAGVNNYKFSG